MSRLAQLQRDLQDASEAVVRAGRVLALHPGVPSVLATLKTVENRRASLERQFFDAELEKAREECKLTHAAWRDACTRLYRLEEKQRKYEETRRAG